jgi:ribosomal protein S18 acetylase RimI-like enzyme
VSGAPTIRRARGCDVLDLSQVFDAAWREAYRGIIPGLALERIIAQRDGAWWARAMGRGRSMAVVEAGERVVGYASYGRARSGTLRCEGEIDELYLAPEYQGLGLGRRLFRAVRNDLADHGLPRVGVWALDDNERARGFYTSLGGIEGPQAVDRIAGLAIAKRAYIFT